MPNAGIMASAVVPPSAGVDILLEPFNNFTAAPWVLGSGPTIVAARTGTGAQISGTLQRAHYVIPTGPLQTDTLTVGFWWKSAADMAAIRNIVEFRGDGTTIHNTTFVSTSGQIVVTGQAATAVATSAAGLIVANTGYYLEVSVKLADSPNGTVAVRLNGSPIITAAGLDTKNGGTATVYNQVRLPAPSGSGGTHLYDDLYIVAGAAFKGDITIP